MKNLKKISRENLKAIKGGNPRSPSPNGTCPAGWRLCTVLGGGVMCVSTAQVEIFCTD